MLSIGKRVESMTERKETLEVQRTVSRQGEVFGQDFESILCEGGHVDSGGKVGEEVAISDGGGELACL
jgi:hypothetical protein